MPYPCCCQAPNPETTCNVFSCAKNWRQNLFVSWSGYSLASSDPFLSTAVIPDLFNGSATIPYVGPGCVWSLYLPATFGPHSAPTATPPQSWGAIDMVHRLQVLFPDGGIPQFFTILDGWTDSSYSEVSSYAWTDCSDVEQESAVFGVGNFFGLSTASVEEYWTIDCNARTATWNNPSGTGAPTTNAEVARLNYCGGMGNVNWRFHRRVKLNQVVIEF